MAEIITLTSATPSVSYLCQRDKRLAKVISMVGDISYSIHEDGYSFLVHEIIEQMLSIKAGAKIYGRLENLCSGVVAPDRINALSDEEIRATGTASSKVSYIRGITNAITSRELDLSELNVLPDKDVIKKLTSFKGVGNWTAKMYLIFVLNRPDVLPVEDGAFLQTYRWAYKTDDCSKEAVFKKCRKWKPYSSIASRYFYKALDAGMTKEKFHLFN